MSTAGDILSVVPGLQATSLAVNAIPKNLDFGIKMRGKKMRGKMHGKKVNYNPNYKSQTKTMLKGSVQTMVGISLLGPTASMINKL